MGKSSRRRRSRSRSRDRRRSRSVERRCRTEDRRRRRSSSSDSESYRHRNSSGHRRRRRRYSRSSSESRSRSRERSDRKRRRRRHSSSRSLSRSTSRERTSSLTRKHKRDRASGDGGIKETGKPSQRDFSKDIPGYSDMTPAERVKAKLKLMLERSTSGLVTQTQKEATPPAPPTSSQLASIENEDFTAELFVSHRTAGNHAAPSPAPHPSATQTRTVDPSEYQPQVVILDDRLSEGGSGVEEEVCDPQKEQPQPSPAPETAGSPAVGKTQRWLLKLQKMRGKFAAPPTD